MIFTNVKTKNWKLGSLVVKEQTLAQMVTRLSKSRRIYLDTETMAVDFFAQEHIDHYLMTRQDEGKKITEKTKQSAIKHAEEVRSQFCFDPKRSTVSVLQINDGVDMYIIDLKLCLRLVNDLMNLWEAISRKPIAGHNLKFDLKVLMHNFPEFEPGETFCTMIGHKIALAQDVVGFFHSRLDNAVSHWLGVELKKGHGADDWSLPMTEEQFIYCLEDVKYLPELVEKQITFLNERSINETKTPYFDGMIKDRVTKIESQFVLTLAAIELAGMPLNKKAMEKQLAESQKEFDKKVKQFESAGVNTKSPAQLLKYLDSQGINVMDTSKEELTKYASKPMVAELLRVKKLQKEIQMIEDYLHEWCRPDGRIYSSYNQIRATSGRMSSSDPNAQQIPRHLKDMFYLSTKKTPIFKADYPAIEARTMGVIANDKTIIEIFQTGGDMHTITAASFLHKDPKEVTAFERLKGKAANFGFMFGMGGLTYTRYAFDSYGLTVPLTEANATRNAYLRKYSGVRHFQEKNSFKLSQSPTIVTETLLGRKMRCDGFTNANNYPVQGSAADIIKLAANMYYFKAKKLKLQTRIVNIVHDELVCESSQRDHKKSMALLKESMESAAYIALQLFDTPVTVEKIKP